MQELSYFMFFFFLSWLLPLLVMLFCYISITVVIFRRAKNSSLGCNSG
jgi:hypothetical protein